MGNRSAQMEADLSGSPNGSRRSQYSGNVIGGNAKVHLGDVHNYCTHDDLESSQHQPKLKLQLMQWLSKIPHRKHHSNMLKELLPGSGQWLEGHHAFQSWVSIDKSSILWLHGIPGSGKSRLAAQVIDKLSNNLRQDANNPLVAYFYCSRSFTEPERADPNQLFRSLLKQLTFPLENAMARPKLLEIYLKKKKDGDETDSEPEPLSNEDCVELISDVCGDTTTMIIIDALDECDPGLRYQLLMGIETIMSNSGNLVKIFITSRDDADIVMRLSTVPNIYIKATDNAQDICAFVHARVDAAILERRLLRGKVSENLRDLIISALIQNAQSMFLAVALQIEILCDHRRIKLPDDIEIELKKPAKSLHDLWAFAFNQLISMHESSRNAALCALRWVLFAQTPLLSHQLAIVIKRELKVDVQVSDILDLCCNLVVYDAEMDVFRCAHLSVNEYLLSTELLSPEKAQLSIALQCLRDTISLLSFDETKLKLSLLADLGPRAISIITYRLYAALYWPSHCRLAGERMAPELMSLVALILGKKEVRNLLNALQYMRRFVHNDITEATLDRWNECRYDSEREVFLVCVWDFHEFLNWEWTSEFNLSEIVNHHGESLLTLSCRFGCTQIAKILIERGMNVDNTPFQGRTRYPCPPQNPLCVAIHTKHYDIADMLLSAGADVDLPWNNFNRSTPLCIAVQQQNFQLVQRLLSRTKNVDGKDFYNPLCDAVETTNLEMCTLLLQHGANPNFKHGNDLPLSLACQIGDENIVKALIHHGASLDEAHRCNSPALVVAASRGHGKVVEVLLQSLTTEQIPKSIYDRAMIGAVRVGKIEIVRQMLDHNIKIPSTSAKDGASILAHAIDSGPGCLEMVRLLLNHGIDPSIRFHYVKNCFYKDCTASDTSLSDHSCEYWQQLEDVEEVKENEESDYDVLKYAARFSSPEVIDVLIGNIADRVQRFDLNTMIFSALRGSNLHMVRYLLQKGSNINAREKGTTTSHFAVHKSDSDIITELLVKGVDINAIDDKRGPALHYVWVCGGKREEVYDMLIEAGACIDATGGQHDSLLQALAYYDCHELIPKALRHGASIKVGAGKSGGPVHAAASRGNVRCMQELLRADVDLNFACEPFGTPLSAAACHGRQPISRMLRQKTEDSIHQCQTEWSRLSPYMLDQYIEAADSLLAHGVDVNASGGVFGSAIQAAAYAGNYSVVRWLIDLDADVATDIGFYGSVLQAAAAGASETAWINMLGADNENDYIYYEDFETPPSKLRRFEVANFIDYRFTTDILIKAGADANATGGFFGCPLQAAACGNTWDNWDIARKLLDAGAEVTEDGQGAFKGCLSAAISATSRVLSKHEMKLDPEGSNPDVVLELLLKSIPPSQYVEMCDHALQEAIEIDNDKGIEQLMFAADRVAQERQIDFSPLDHRFPAAHLQLLHEYRRSQAKWELQKHKNALTIAEMMADLDTRTSIEPRTLSPDISQTAHQDIPKSPGHDANNPIQDTTQR